jgi:hypothetical protein
MRIAQDSLEYWGFTRNPGDFLLIPVFTSCPLCLQTQPSEISASESDLAQQMLIGLCGNVFPRKGAAQCQAVLLQRWFRFRRSGWEGQERSGMPLAKSLGLLINKLKHCFSSPLWGLRKLDPHCVLDSIYGKRWGELLLRDWFGREDDSSSATFKR